MYGMSEMASTRFQQQEVLPARTSSRSMAPSTTIIIPQKETTLSWVRYSTIAMILRQLAQLQNFLLDGDSIAYMDVNINVPDNQPFTRFSHLYECD